MVILNSSWADLDWWEEKVLTGYNKIHNKFVLEIFSDASGSGWGAACNGEVIFGTWSNEKRENHINYLELMLRF